MKLAGARPIVTVYAFTTGMIPTTNVNRRDRAKQKDQRYVCATNVPQNRAVVARAACDMTPRSAVAPTIGNAHMKKIRGCTRDSVSLRLAARETIVAKASAALLDITQEPQYERFAGGSP